MTLKYLLFRPGYLPKEYVSGKRSSYLHPVRMYVFTSAFFFLYFFSTVVTKDSFKINGRENRQEQLEGKIAMIDSLNNDKTDSADKIQLYNLKLKYDSLLRLEDTSKQKTTDSILKANNIVKYKDGSNSNSSLGSFKKNKNGDVDFFSAIPDSIKTYEQYETIQEGLPHAKRDSWVKDKFAKKYFSIKKQYKGFESAEFGEVFIEKFLHSIPTILFFSLPLYALILQLLYVTHKKRFYSEHAIFSIYQYIAIFIFIFLFIVAGQLSSGLHIHWIKKWLQWIIALYYIYYTYNAMRTFYAQGRGKTLLKYGLLAISAFIIRISLAAIFLLVTFLNV